MDAQLGQLLHRCSQSHENQLEIKDLTFLASAISRPISSSLRAQAYVILSLFIAPATSNDVQAANNHDSLTETKGQQCITAIKFLLHATNKDDLEIAIGFLEAIFHVDGYLGSRIFLEEGILTAIMDGAEIYSNVPNVVHATARLISQACGYKTCRNRVSVDCFPWLKAELHRQGVDPSERACVASALLKLTQGKASSSQADAPESSDLPELDIDLISMLKTLVVESKGLALRADALEGLVYGTTDPSVKDLLSHDPVFLEAIFSCIPTRQSIQPDTPSSLFYGIATIISNLVAFPPPLSDQEEQIQKLRKFAAKGLSPQPFVKGSNLDQDSDVRKRIERLVKAGCLYALTRLSRITDSSAVRQTLAKAFLDIVEMTNLRGQVLQAGGSKALLRLLRDDNIPSPSTPNLRYGQRQNSDASSFFIPIQALAKLSITASPMQVFGPDGNAAKEAVRPFTMLVVHSKTTLLQKFEALMALTNLATMNAELASRVARSDGLMDKVEYLLLDDHRLVRRASVELICNLVGATEEAFARFSGISDEPSPAIKSKLHILAALADVEDVPTRLAASASLAILTNSKAVSSSLATLQFNDQRVIPILLRLIDVSQNLEDESTDVKGSSPLAVVQGLFLRGLTCFQNILWQLDGEDYQQFALQASKGELRSLLVRGFEALGPTDPVMRESMVKIFKRLEQVNV